MAKTFTNSLPGAHSLPSIHKVPGRGRPTVVKRKLAPHQRLKYPHQVVAVEPEDFY